MVSLGQGNAVHNGRLFTHQFNVALIDRQTVEARAVQRAESLKVLQSVHFFKHRGVAAEGGRGVKAAGAATAGFLTVAGVRCGVGAEEGAAEAAGDQLRRAC